MQVIFKTIFGSKLYGLATPSSDTDYKGIYLPSFSEAILNNYPKSIREKSNPDTSRSIAGDVETEVYSLQYFLKLAADGQTAALDMLFGPKELREVYDPMLDFIFDNKEKFLSKRLNALMGYASGQAIKYSNKAKLFDALRSLYSELVVKDFDLKLAEDKNLLTRYIVQYKKLGIFKFETKNEKEIFQVDKSEFYLNGPRSQLLESLSIKIQKYGERTKNATNLGNADWKALSHAFRTIYVAQSIAKTGTFSYPLIETDFVMAVKLGELSYEYVVDKLDEEFFKTKELINSSDLPEKADLTMFDEWLVDLYKRKAKEE